MAPRLVAEAVVSVASINRGVRIGAAAFALGLSLAGPQALGVASAEGAETDSSSVSAGSTAGDSSPRSATNRRDVGRAARAADAGGSPATSIPRGSASGPEGTPAVGLDRPTAKTARSAAARIETRQIPALPPAVRPASATAPGAVSDRVPQPLTPVSVPAAAKRATVAAVVAVVPNVASAPAATPAAAVADITDQPVVAALSPQTRFIYTVAAEIVGAIDRAGVWLSGLPTNGPIGDFLSGALLLMRRSVEQLVGWDPTPDCVRQQDCSGAFLNGMKFGRANFSGVNLTGAQMSYATFWQSDFSGANLTQANVTQSTLTESNLTDANLFRASLGGSNLQGVNLTRANLDSAFVNADLLDANLTDANLTNVQWGGTTCPDGSFSGTNPNGACSP